ncbi:MAG TPA: 4Fe-4S ferredoxin [Clostridiales bacterium UBA8153]|nr:4Fe-4S ferredoxin [Clostridiales bacterium UBA8153]
MDAEKARDRLFQDIATFVEGNSLNLLPECDGIRIYDAPLLGVASAGDGLFEQFLAPEVIGPHHRLPGQWLTGARSVLSYFLPFSLPVRASNRGTGAPSEEWLYGRIGGEALNNAVRARLVEMVTELGGRAVAPALDPRYQVVDRKSNWSERHAGYAAGLGSFGLGRSFITARGSAGRMGSVITDLELPPTSRQVGPYGYCPQLTGGTCGECIPRCPVRAIEAEGKALGKCQSYLDFVRKKFAPRYGCGKCQTAVPCEAAIPSGGLGEGGSG